MFVANYSTNSLVWTCLCGIVIPYYKSNVKLALTQCRKCVTGNYRNI